MTSRLKHKLELENINLKSAYLNESFVQIGTPLPALSNTKKDQLEYVPEWQQEVRDEKGRKRFHGAFTGGFSAGYYNTVGSKEGWAPSSFKSSRTNRAQKVQRAEDFMDEEDLQQMNDDRKLENTETFRTDGFGGTKEELANRSLPTALESLIAPTRTSIGQSLLQKLGWRQGQGIGPRVTLRKLKWQEGKLGKARLGIKTDDDDVDEVMGDEEGKKHTFAPRDTRLLVYEAKDDREGLGYVKGRGMGRLPGQSRSVAGPSRAPDDDDDDPYGDAGAGASSSSALAFAFDQGGEDDDVIVMGGPSKVVSTSRNGQTGKDAPVDDKNRWHDGRPVLAGFELDPLGVPADKWFEMPEIPPDWRPRPARVWGTIRRFDDTPQIKQEEPETIRGAPGRPLTFEQRGAALGEEQRVSKAKSVFEYMSEKDRERVAAVAAAAKQGAPPPMKTEEQEPQPEDTPRPPADEVVIPPLSPRTASAALRGFMPYADDLQRQERYRSYLTSQTYNTKEPNPVLKPQASFDDINKELEDFAQSARIFKPMSFAMSSRFTTGSAALATSDLKQAKPGLHLFDAEKAKLAFTKPKEPDVEVKKVMTPREQAADSGMYGRLTREVKEFYPVKLLCRRFGVADPHPEGAPPDGDGDASSSAANGMDLAPLPKNDASWESAFVHKSGSDQENLPGPSTETNGAGEGEERAPKSIAEVGMADDVNQGRDTLTYTKPSIDIFKAIFASDDEDDDDDEEEEDKETTRETRPAALLPTERAKRVDPFPPRDEKPADLATFKPVFRRNEGNEVEPAAGPSSADGAEKDKKKKNEKEKKKRKGVLSFAVDEGEEDEERSREEKRKKRDKKEKERNGQGFGTGTGIGHGNGEKQKDTDTLKHGDDEGEWVEKTLPPARLAQRKGAADFM